MPLFVVGSDLRAWVFPARVSTGARRPVRVFETRSSGSREPGSPFPDWLYTSDGSRDGNYTDNLRLAIPAPHRPELLPIATEPRLEVGTPQGRVGQGTHGEHPERPEHRAHRSGAPQHEKRQHAQKRHHVQALKPADVHNLRLAVRTTRRPVGEWRSTGVSAARATRMGGTRESGLTSKTGETNDGVKDFVSGTHAATFAFLRIHAAVGGWYFRTVLVIFSLID